MNHRQTYFLLSICLVSSCFSGAQADETVETTVQRTTTYSNTPPLNLAVTGSYYAVDPMTGTLKGKYNPTDGLIDGRPLQPGLVIVDRPTGSLVATIDNTGKVVDVSIAPASEVLLVSIDSRRKALDRDLAEALVKGRLTALQASNMRAELDRISADQSAAGDRLSYQKALVVAYDLNTLSQRLSPSVAVTPVISQQIVVLNKQLTLVEPVTYRRVQLTNRIDDEYQAGRLSADYVSRLKAQIDKELALETRYRKNGELSSSKSKLLSIKLDQVESNLNHDVANINEKRAKIGIRVN